MAEPSEAGTACNGREPTATDCKEKSSQPWLASDLSLSRGHERRGEIGA